MGKAELIEHIGRNYLNTCKSRGYEYEARVIARLHENGIPADRGGNLRRHTDIVAWGCVFIEVKASMPFNDSTYKFSFTPDQRKRGLLADLLVLYCADSARVFVFEADYEAFYRVKDGKRELRYQVNYTPNRSNRGGVSIITDEIMDAHEDAWDRVEKHRLRISASLKRALSITDDNAAYHELIEW